MPDPVVVVVMPAELVADFEAWLRRYGRELLPSPGGRVVSRPMVYVVRAA